MAPIPARAQMVAIAAAMLMTPSVAHADQCPPGTSPSVIATILPGVVVVVIGALLSVAVFRGIKSSALRVILILAVAIVTAGVAVVAVALGGMMAPCV